MIKRGLIILLLPFFLTCKQSENNQLSVPQLNGPVEIITDPWGVPHIYAGNEHDLFFAQGYQAAKDRLFQLEIFRRRANGTMAEVLGAKELNRDIGARLFKYRGDLNEEFAHYHPHGKSIITAFTEGINAFVQQVIEGRQPMPVELEKLGIKPGLWTPEIVVSRHNGWVNNVQEELSIARMIKLIGEEKTRAITNFHPRSPDLSIDRSIDRDALFDDVLGPYNDFRAPVSFTEEGALASGFLPSKNGAEGSNNWVLSGQKTLSGSPILASDPHRVIGIPSIRYIVHLSAPGWNVIGGGEPVIPGVSIGHNDHGAWGLTIFETDTEDLYVYKLNPANTAQYFYKGKWLDFEKLRDTIRIKGQPDKMVDLLFTIHGPVTHVDEKKLTAYAIRAAWLTKGSAPYLSSLRINQAKNWEEFRAACSYSFVPAENMIWADRQGNIGWQTIGIAPIRNSYSGMVPVPGDGRFEWEGLLPVLERPWKLNPPSGFINTANANTTPEDYPHMNAIGYSWTDSFRARRAYEVLSADKKFSMPDMQSLQMDYLSIPAREIRPLLKGLRPIDEKVKKAQQILMDWDLNMSENSVAASIYFIFEILVERSLLEKMGLVNDSLPQFGISLSKAIKMIKNPAPLMTTAERDELLLMSLIGSVSILRERLGGDMNEWKYGQEKMKHVYMVHPLSSKNNSGFNIGPAPRGGDGNTINSSGGSLNQSFGASLRFIFDCSNWDLAVATNTPGQSGVPGSPHYKDLFDSWSKNQYFPLYYSRDKISGAGGKKLKLVPEK
ncbi:MAG TPA: penicillin acylase family protein [Chitinophagaceae bacterium]|nr:penicillin acylase family protein [Chitinophagaceae bacterium]